MIVLPPLTEAILPGDPLDLFREWLAVAEAQSGLDNPNAIFLTTVGADEAPEGRIVLLKEVREDGFVFYTNRRSRKGQDLDARPQAGLTFYWDVLGRQVRVVGSVTRVSDDESDAYFASRARGSQIGAWASDQSQPLASRAELEGRVKEFEARFASAPVPRPEHWGGYCVRPRRIEFWQAGEFRLHDRFEYNRQSDGTWAASRLNP